MEMGMVKKPAYIMDIDFCRTTEGKEMSAFGWNPFLKALYFICNHEYSLEMALILIQESLYDIVSDAKFAINPQFSLRNLSIRIS